jgi:hypothetical protein
MENPKRNLCSRALLAFALHIIMFGCARVSPGMKAIKSFWKISGKYSKG